MWLINPFCAMPAHAKRDKQEEAYALFMNSDLTQAEIAERVGVAPKTLSSWVKKDEWHTQKAANSVTRKRVITGYLMQLHKLQEEIQNRKDHPYPNTRESDIITKITKAIKSLEKGLTLSDYITATEELCRFGMNIDDKAMRQALPIIKEFIQVKARELQRL